MGTFYEIKQMKLKILKDVEYEVAVVIESSQQNEESAESGKVNINVDNYKVNA
jgi:hypothetical protein